MKRLLASLFAVLALSANAQNMGFPTQFGATFPLLAPNGTAAAPSYSFASASGSGLYIAGSSIGFSHAGALIISTQPSAFVFGLSPGTVDIGSPTGSARRFYLDYTNTGTVGAVTINKAAGRVNIAAAGTSVVVTNSFATANAEIMAVASVNDATCWVKSVVPAAGSFTITTNAACTAQTAFSYFIVNTD